MARTSSTLYACDVCGTEPSKSQKSSVLMAKDRLRAVRIYQQYGSRGNSVPKEQTKTSYRKFMIPQL
jgi:hypothetical protein